MANKKCGFKKKSGELCKLPAGWGTEHVGTGCCRKHGGNGGRPLKTGRDSKVIKKRLSDRIAHHLQNPDPLNLTPELAMLRALIDYFKEKLDSTIESQDVLRETYTEKELLGLVNPYDAAAAALTEITDNIRKVVDTISKVQAREALTSNESLYLLVSLADVLQTEIAYIRREAISDEEAIKHIVSKLRSRVELPGQTRGQALLLGDGD